jgi:hypothetical protein
MQTCQIVIALFAALFTVGATGQSDSYFWWIANVEKSQPVADSASPTFVVYGVRDSIDMKWTFKNDEGTKTVAVVPRTLESKVKIKMTTVTGPIDVDMTWAPAGSWFLASDATPVRADDIVQLQPGDRLEWQASVRRRDAGPFTLGKYDCAIDMAAALRTLSSDGIPWRGRAVVEGKLTIHVADGNSLTARRAGHMARASDAIAAGTPFVAVAEYRALLQADPTDWRTGYAGLGLALVAARQFKEGAAALEVVLPLVLNEKSSIPHDLAYAYMALGDEANASRVLRMVVPESQLTARLERLRALVRTLPR